MMVLVAVFALIAASPLFDPARLKEGSLPEGAGPQAGGGEVWLELSLTETGDVKDVLPMRETPPFTESLRRSVAQWRFEPAREGSAAVASRVLVVGVFRPPTLLGPVAGEAPHDQATASPEIPFPANLTWPPYPPRAVGDARSSSKPRWGGMATSGVRAYASASGRFRLPLSMLSVAGASGRRPGPARRRLRRCTSCSASAVPLWVLRGGKVTDKGPRAGRTIPFPSGPSRRSSR